MGAAPRGGRLTPEALEAGAWLAERGAVLPESALATLDAYAKDVLEYGARTNLTAASTAAELWRRHILDGLAALAPLRSRLEGKPRPRVLDLGCGGGFVGVALAAAWPEAEVWLVDSVYKKTSFLTWTTTRLRLPNVRVVHGRADGTGALELLRHAGGASGRTEPMADAVTARALAPRDEAFTLARPLAAPGGWTALFTSDRPEEGETEVYRLPGEEKDRYISFVRKEPT
ncbi:16S rRNA (guanine(527)-N(7))-methyltransferase RsmG [bacterium]|nr:MAG: 16S rRNA (guanine(527)-N(7))-methyltransferase RsmG [bacterium]